MYNFPDQTIPESKKTEEWHKEHVVNWVNFTIAGSYQEDKLEIERLYFAHSAKAHPIDEQIIKKTITERFCDLNLGPGYDIYPLIEYFIEQLVGDYRLRPLRYFALVQNKDAIVAKLDEIYDVYLEKIMRKIHGEIAEEEGIEIPTDKPDIELPEDDDEEFFKNFRTNSEKQAENILYFLLIIKKEKEIIYNALLHYLIAGSVSLIMAKKDGHPTVKIGHPLFTDYDVDTHNIIQDNPQYYSYSEFMGINEILNNYDLSDKKKKAVNDYAGTATSAGFRAGSSSYWFDGNQAKGGFRVRVVTMIWKSRKKTKFKRYYTKDGIEEMKILPEDYKKRKDDDIVTVEIEDIRHCTMIGPEIVLEFGSQKDQLKPMHDQKKRVINVLCINANNKTGANVNRSMAKKLKFLQDYASEILYELKIAMRQIDGGALVYDVGEIPKEWMKHGVDKALEKVNYTLKKDKMIIVNRNDKRSNAYASSVNISQKSKVGDLMNMLTLIEALASKISGVNGSKMGDQADYTKSTVAQMNLMQANSRIENIYGPFDTFIEKFLERIVLFAQNIYKEGEVYNYYAGDKGLKFLKIMPDVFIDDIGVTLSDPRKELQAKEIIDNASSQLIPNMQDPRMFRELIKIHMSESASEAIEVFDKALDQMDKAAKERQAAQTQQAQAAAQAEQAKAEAQVTMAREGNQTDLATAQIYKDGSLQESSIKETNENLRTAAKIEKDLRVNASRENNKIVK